MRRAFTLQTHSVVMTPKLWGVRCGTCRTRLTLTSYSLAAATRLMNMREHDSCCGVAKHDIYLCQADSP